MTSDVTIILFLLIIVAAMTMTSMKDYPLLILIGLIAAALYKSETFVDAPPVDGDNVDMAIGQPTPEFDQSVAPISTAVNTKWDNNDAVNQMFAREPESTDGDQRLFDQQKHVGSQAKAAILARSRFTSDNFRPIVQEELDEASKSAGWWDDDSLDSKFVKDDVDYMSGD